MKFKFAYKGLRSKFKVGSELNDIRDNHAKPCMYNDAIIMKHLPDNDVPKLIPLAIDPNCHCGMAPDLQNEYVIVTVQHHAPCGIQLNAPGKQCYGL